MISMEGAEDSDGIKCIPEGKKGSLFENEEQGVVE